MRYSTRTKISKKGDVIVCSGWKYQIPGPAYGSTYKFYYTTTVSPPRMIISLDEGTGEVYDPIEIVRIETSETVDNRKQKRDAIIPDHLDVSDYEEVARYYGFRSEQ